MVANLLSLARESRRAAYGARLIKVVEGHRHLGERHVRRHAVDARVEEAEAEVGLAVEQQVDLPELAGDAVALGVVRVVRGGVLDEQVDRGALEAADVRVAQRADLRARLAAVVRFRAHAAQVVDG